MNFELPAAFVTIQLLTLRVTSAALLAAIETATAPYVRAILGHRELGRSAVIPKGVTSIDLRGARSPWIVTTPVGLGEAVLVRVEVWDAAEQSVPLATIMDVVSPPWATGSATISTSADLNLDLDVTEVAFVPPAPDPTITPPNAAGAPAVQGVVELRPVVLATITDVEGLYRPESPGERQPGVRGAKRTTGYKSHDDRGRIYLNRDRASDEQWRSDHQSVEVSVELIAVRGLIPRAAHVRWTVLVPPDPTNDDPGVHVEWGAYIDPDDYDEDAVPLGFGDGRNEGDFDHVPRWEAVPGYVLTVVSDSVARTSAVPVAGRPRRVASKVIIHCPNLAGDRLIVRAELDDPSNNTTSFADQTGRMTMWNRVDVEYIIFEGANPIPVEQIPQHFEPMCTQLQFLPPRLVPKALATLAPSERAMTDQVALRVGMGLFRRKREKGWLCLIAANRAFPDIPAGRSLFAGVVTPQPDGAHREAESDSFVFTPDAGVALDVKGPVNAIFRWTDARLNPPAEVTILFPARLEPQLGHIRVVLAPNSHTPLFKAEGSGRGAPVAAGPDLLCLPNRQRLSNSLERGASSTHVEPTWKAGGYQMPANVNVEVHGAGLGYRGFTPTRSVVHHGIPLVVAVPVSFVFTAAIADPHRSVQVAIHEITHALGHEHMCGYWNYRSNRLESCCMTYSNQWVLSCSAKRHLDDESSDMFLQLIPGTAGRVGRDHCGRHIKEGRRVHLEDHLGLAWK